MDPLTVQRLLLALQEGCMNFSAFHMCSFYENCLCYVDDIIVIVDVTAKLHKSIELISKVCLSPV